MSNKDKDISSAEMTATWRSDEPDLSLDPYSIQMVSEAGYNMTREYQQKEYPLASRHLSLRAGYILRQACHLLRQEKYDGVISMASGLSLLTHCIASELDKKSNVRNLLFIDTDIEKMIDIRIQKIKEIQELPSIQTKGFEQKIFDIEKSYEEAKLNKRSFKSFFPDTIKKPLFILEGITYFLTRGCLEWVFEGMKSYDDVAIVFDYFPSNLVERSRFFKKVVEFFKTNLPENVKTLVEPEYIEMLCTGMNIIADKCVREIELELVTTKPHLLEDENTHVPVHVRVMEKKP